MTEPRRVVRPVQVLLGIALGLSTAALATWASIHSLGIVSTDQSQLWLPSTPRGELTLAEQRFAARQKLTPDDQAAVENLAARLPLSNEPFDWIGYSALLDGDVERAIKLLEEAKARRPRSRVARMALMQIHATRGDIDPLAAELVPLLRLEPELVSPLTEQWVAAAKSPQDIVVLARILRTNPALFATVAESAARNKLPPDLLMSFLANSPLPDTPEAARLDRMLLLALVEQGDIANARLAWSERAKSRTASSSLVYSPEFTDRTSPPPFNWELNGGRNGVTVFRREGGVFLDYFGRGSSPFLRQLVTLPPGAYRLVVEQQPEPGGGGLSWTIRCNRGDSDLLEQPVNDSRPGMRAAFSVPAGCTAQWLTLESRSTLRRGEGQQMTVMRVNIEPVGAR